ncbi:hypothetical protein LTR08_004898 [Meristemomyces frigidus]|nr:hypothetical protein LTR08_004898 [Meristemomyces frigidus]
MPPAKPRPAPEDSHSRSEGSTTREKAVAAAAHARRSKNGAPIQQNGSGLKELALVSTESGNVIVPGSTSTGMAWNTVPIDILNTYRLAHTLPTPAAFSSPLNQARLTNPGIGRQSPTMARRKEKRRISKEQLATAVRKNFNSAAVNEIDVVVDLVYKVKHKDKAFRMRSLPTAAKKS